MFTEEFCFFQSTDNLIADVTNDYFYVLKFINNVVKPLSPTPVSISTKAVQTIILQMRQQFPYHDGDYTQASPFKKMAYFMALFIELKPLPSPFSAAQVGRLSLIPNHQNVIVSLFLAVKSLHCAVLDTEEGEKTVSNDIELTLHSFIDIVDAFSTAKATESFKTLSVLLEQLVYKTNPDCQYSEKVNFWIPEPK